MEQGLVQVLTAEELTNKVNSESEEKQKVENDAANLVNSLVQHINKKWIDAKDAKLIIEQEMLWSVYQRRGEYTPSKLSQIKAVEQPEIFMNITETKCRNGVAQIKDVIMQPGKRIFSVTPTPVPELPPDVTQKVQEGVLQMYVQMAMMQAQQTGQPISSAQLRELIAAKAEEIKATVHKEIIKVSKKMADDIETQIDDDFLQGGFYDAIDRIIDDIVGLKCGIIKGPIFRREKVKESVTDQETGKIKRQITEKVMPQYERRSPFCIYPSPRSTGVNDGYLFDVIILKPKQIHDLIGVEGYNEEEIRAVLKEFKNGALKNDWLELSPEAKEGFGEEDQRKVSTYYPYENIYCLELWDEVNGQELLDWGMSEEEITDPEDEYSVCIWKIGNHIIKAMLNYDQLGRKPFGVTSFQKQNDTFWGRGIPEMIEDCQQVCNACARAILSNVGIASQPMTDLNIDRIETGSSRKIWPGRVFPTTDEQMGSGSKAVNFYQPPMVTDKLMSVYITFSKIADEHSGVPAFSHGGAAVGGAGSTSSGLHQLREMAAQGIRAVVRNLDNDVIIPCLEFHYDYLLDNKDIFGLIGDYKMVAEGSSALIAKEQMVMRKNEFLQATANPVDMQIIGVENRRKMLFEVAKSLGIEIEDSPFPPPMPPPQQTAPNEKPATLDDSGNPVQGTDNRVASPSRPRQEVSSSGRSGGAGNALPQMANGGVIDEGGIAEVHNNELVANVGGRAVVIPNADKVISSVPEDSPVWGRKSQVLPDGTFIQGGGKWGQTPPPNTDNRSVGTMAMDVLGAGANKVIDTIGKHIPKPSDLRQFVASKQAPVQPSAKPLSDIQIRFSRLTPEQQAHVNVVQNGVIDSQEALAMIDFFEAENAGR